MGNKAWKILGLIGLAGCLAWSSPDEVSAAEAAVTTSSALYARIDAPVTSVLDRAGDDGGVMSEVSKGQAYEVTEQVGNGWVKIKTPAGEGYIKERQATLIEKTTQTVDQGVRLRQDVVQYALSFLGNPYVYGGSDPHTGVDCSGFTRYIMQNAAGISLSHSSTAQSKEGQSISYSEARPGDLIFYGSGSHINHVAIYIGNGQIVHASTERTGIKISDAMYRPQVRVVRVLP